ncbi:ribosomal RNA small subunit methyltransferase A [candidate division KSB1 bacterium]|nr:ribosomal RNA small subunit methyltransferase A [candidate division KSB1 bacterium]
MDSKIPKSLNFRPKKRFGQNFLIDENVLGSIVAALDLQTTDIVMEIGPGTGALSKYIQPVVSRLIAVEIDHQLAAQLRRQFGRCENYHLLEEDFLDVDLAHYAGEKDRLRIVGNIPYNITSDIIFHVFEQRRFVRDMTLLVQREVAERLVAEPRSKAYGILSVFSQTFADVRMLLRVPATVFSPRPKVDSALVQWRFTDQRSRNIPDEALFRRVVRIAFGQRRKMLRKSLREAFAIDRLVDWDLTRRPEELNVSEWIKISIDLLQP